MTPPPAAENMRRMQRHRIVAAWAALACGVALTYLQGWLGLILLALGAFFVLFYTWPLKYIGPGELAVVIVWGPLMIGGGYYAITGVWDWNVILVSLVYALGPTCPPSCARGATLAPALRASASAGGVSTGAGPRPASGAER